MATQPLLDLSTLTDSRPPIRIDGATYHLKTSEELSLAESQQFTSWGNRLEELGADAVTHEVDLEILLAEVARAAVADVPETVMAKLSSSQLMSIVQVFTGLLLGRRLRLAGAIAAQVTNRPIGENSSPVSNSSSAETLTAGSTAPPAHS